MYVNTHKGILFSLKGGNSATYDMDELRGNFAE